jgi:hypothetical protein
VSFVCARAPAREPIALQRLLPLLAHSPLAPLRELDGEAP